MTDPAQIKIPTDLLPADGRFGCGPSKVRPEALAALAAEGAALMGTSHRQTPVKALVGRLRSGLNELFSLPEGYEVILGNGGTTVLWDALTFGLIDTKSQHLSFGEFSSKFANAAKAAPFIGDPQIIKSEPGTHPEAETAADVDLYALTHNETSTGVAMDIRRPENATGLVAVDATSGAGALRVDPTQFDFYYFAPQKVFASDGGLWVGLASPAALERIANISSSGRWIPASIDLATALDNSTKNQTYNTPAVATIFLMVNQIEWMLANGGLEFAASRSDRSAEVMYNWAEQSAFASPFVGKPHERSHVVAAIDIDDSIAADDIIKALRANGIVDTDGYRKLGRNQLRVGMFPAVETSDIEALTKSLDYVVGQLS